MLLKLICTFWKFGHRTRGVIELTCAQANRISGRQTDNDNNGSQSCSYRSEYECCCAVRSWSSSEPTREMSSCLVEEYLWACVPGLSTSPLPQRCSSCLHTSAPADERSWRLLPAGSDMSANWPSSPPGPNTKTMAPIV